MPSDKDLQDLLEDLMGLEAPSYQEGSLNEGEAPMEEEANGLLKELAWRGFELTYPIRRFLAQTATPPLRPGDEPTLGMPYGGGLGTRIRRLEEPLPGGGDMMAIGDLIMAAPHLTEKQIKDYLTHEGGHPKQAEFLGPYQLPLSMLAAAIFRETDESAGLLPYEKNPIETSAGWFAELQRKEDERARKRWLEKLKKYPR